MNIVQKDWSDGSPFDPRRGRGILSSRLTMATQQVQVKLVSMPHRGEKAETCIEMWRRKAIKVHFNYCRLLPCL